MTRPTDEIDSRIDLERILAALPPRKRKVATLCKLGLTQSIIAGMLSISQTRVSQILREIRDAFEDIC